MIKEKNMHIIYDPHFDEYGVLMNENFKKVLKKTHADFSKVAPTLGPEFVFSTGGRSKTIRLFWISKRNVRK